MSDVDNILRLAAEEGIEVGLWGGRLTYRGASPTLTAMLKYHEEAVVEALGGEYSAWQELMRPEPPVIKRVAGRHTITERTS